MLITEDFVLLNFPKTGSTFARKVIGKIYKDKCEELLVPAAFNKYNNGRKAQHGTFGQIPLEHRGKVVLSIVRNPFDRYVSQFCFRWYSHSPPAREEILRQIYPGFPEIDFRQFLDMTDRFSKRNILTLFKAPDTDIGFQTVQFLAFYSYNPENALNTLVKGGRDPFSELPPIHFLRQEFLREDLRDFLMEVLGQQNIMKIISSEQDENVSRSPQEKDFRKFWSPDLLSIYTEKERFFLRAFPEYGRNVAVM